MFHLQDHMLGRCQQSLSIQPEPHCHFQNAVAYCCHQYCLATSILSSRVWTFVVGAELAVQSQQRLWDDGTRHPQLQPALSSAGTDKWVLSWRLNEASDSSGDWRAVH